MKTLNIITAVESNALENAATVIFYKDGHTCTVDVISTGQIGHVMNKYYGTDIRLHPVARNDRGHFVSIKGYEQQIKDVAFNSGWINIQEDETVEEVSVFEELPTLNLNTVNLVPNNIVQMAFGKVDQPQPITRIRGGIQLTQEAVVIKLDPDHSQYQEHNPDLNVDQMDTSLEGVIKQACRIFYDYFKDEMYIKTINREQLSKQFSIIWNKNTQFHFHKDAMKYYIFDCIKYYFNEALGNKVYLTKNDFIIAVNKALRQSMALVKAA